MFLRGVLYFKIHKWCISKVLELYYMERSYIWFVIQNGANFAPVFRIWILFVLLNPDLDPYIKNGPDPATYKLTTNLNFLNIFWIFLNVVDVFPNFFISLRGIPSLSKEIWNKQEHICKKIGKYYFCVIRKPGSVSFFCKKGWIWIRILIFNIRIRKIDLRDGAICTKI